MIVVWEVIQEIFSCTQSLLRRKVMMSFNNWERRKVSKWHLGYLSEACWDGLFYMILCFSSWWKPNKQVKHFLSPIFIMELSKTMSSISVKIENFQVTAKCWNIITSHLKILTTVNKQNLSSVLFIKTKMLKKITNSFYILITNSNPA